LTVPPVSASAVTLLSFAADREDVLADTWDGLADLFAASLDRSGPLGLERYEGGPTFAGQLK
jgi:hypothetical protein